MLPIRTALVPFALWLAACSSRPAAPPAVVERTDVVLQWNQQAMLTGGPQLLRTLTITHLSVFDAVNAIERRYTPYLTLPAPPPDASPEAAAAAAAHGVLVRVFPEDATMLRAGLARSLGSVPDGPSKAAGVRYGDLVAEAMVTAYASNGQHAIAVAEVADTVPGGYQFTDPATTSPPVGAGPLTWAPFTMTSGSQFRPDPPPPLTSATYAKDLGEVLRLGGSVSPARPAADEQLARWHAEAAMSQWNRIARAIAATDGHDLLDHARLFALLNVALADAEASAFEAVYTFRFWRPVTAIRNADRDANPETTADRVWSPLLPMPPYPEYPSVQAASQAAAARVLTATYGRFHPFSATSRAVTGVTRAYRDFEAFASEDASAEIVGGLHFRTSIDRGAQEGRKVAEWVLERCLLPADQERATTRCSRNAQAPAAATLSPASNHALPSLATPAAPPPSPSR